MLNSFLGKDKLYLNGDVDYLNNKVSNSNVVDLKDPDNLICEKKNGNVDNKGKSKAKDSYNKDGSSYVDSTSKSGSYKSKVSSSSYVDSTSKSGSYKSKVSSSSYVDSTSKSGSYKSKVSSSSYVDSTSKSGSYKSGSSKSSPSAL
jgi:hypothetical protein